MIKPIRLLEWGGGSLLFYQWGRLKRRERTLSLLIYLVWFLHVVFWLIWIIFVAPYPIAITVPLGFSLGVLSWLRDYLWPLLNLLILGSNTWLISKIYHRDLLSAWLLLGATLFLQIIALGIAISLMTIGL